MILCNLSGGLGNQMFQYALGRAVSEKTQLELKLVVDGFNFFNNHNGYELERTFGLKTSLATPVDLKIMLGTLRSGFKVRRYLSHPFLKTIRGSNFIQEPGFNYYPEVYNLASSGCYLQGYWQSELYFTGITNLIASDFSFIPMIDYLNRVLENKIMETNSVAIHFRRGDYLKSKIHNICDMSYYSRAIELILKQVNNPYFFVFSDDPNLAQESFCKKYKNVVIVDNNKENNSYYDMFLMSICKHNIIANSTFSWWSAWLNKNKNKLVIAPKIWFSSISVATTNDLYPKEWIKL